jgi:HEAT repeat protein
MGRILWPLALVVTFFIGWSASSVARKPSAVTGSDQRQEVSHLQQQVATLQARLRAREDLAAARPSGVGYVDPAPGANSGSGGPRGGRFGSSGEELRFPERRARGGGAAPSQRGPEADRASTTVASPANVQTALGRFYQYLEATNGPDGRERWQRARALIEDLRGMGDAAGHALMQVLAAGTDSDERRSAARLLGQLLRDILDKEDDVLLRRAAASGLRQIQTPDSVSVMERLLANPGEDRFVRLSAAAGLTELGQPAGVAGLTRIFDEATADGRGREMAFRALAALKDDRSVPFMRQVVTSQVEPAYRLQAIRYLTAQGDQQSLGTLQRLMQSPTEQPSIRDAATQAFATLGGK